MSKGKTRCPKCGKHVSVRAVSCPACGAKTRLQPDPGSRSRPMDTRTKKATVTKALIISLICTVVFGFLGFGLESMSSGPVYSLALLLGLNNPGVSFVAKGLFGVSLAVVVVCFAMIQQMEGE